MPLSIQKAKLVFTEYYKPLGWKKQRANYRYIDESGLGKVINFQKSKWNNDGKIDFYINYGLYMEVGNDLVNKLFKEYECQFRKNRRWDFAGKSDSPDISEIRFSIYVA